MKLTPTINMIALAAATAFAAHAFAADFEHYTETFADGNANWADQAQNPLDWVSTGGADGGGYVTNTFNFVDSDGGGFPQILFRGQANLNSSDGAFVGDWLKGDVTQFSFHIRHDAPEELNYFVRIATPGNFPSANAIFPTTVAPGEWTQLTLEIDPDNPIIEMGGGSFESVFSNVGNIQIGVEGDPLFGKDIDVVFDLDLVAAVPSPGALALIGIAGLLGGRRRRAC